MKRILLLLAIVAATLTAEAQNKKEQQAELLRNLKQTSFTVATGFDAVVLAEVIDAGVGMGYQPAGETKALNLARQTISRRVKILNDAGCRYATISFSSYELDGFSNDIVSKKYITATCYNLEGDKIVKTQLSARDIKQTRADNGEVRFEFTIPNVKAGSIIEYTYSVQEYAYDADRYKITMQGELPKLSSVIYFQDAGRDNLAHQNIYVKQGKIDIVTLQWEEYLRFRNGLNTGKYSVIQTYSNGYVDMPEPSRGYCFAAYNLPAITPAISADDIAAIVVVKGTRN